MWKAVLVDGEQFFWHAYTARCQVGDGPLQPSECLVVARRPYEEGVHADGVNSRAYPVGTRLDEVDAIETLRWLIGRGSGI
jgi:hypothetical protein